MKDMTTNAAQEYLKKLSKIDGLTANQLSEIIKAIRMVNIMYQPQVQYEGLIRASVMLENHLEVMRILDK